MKSINIAFRNMGIPEPDYRALFIVQILIDLIFIKAISFSRQLFMYEATFYLNKNFLLTY